MNPYHELIAKEKAKLELLRKKVAACEQLIAALNGTDTDDIDIAIAKQMGQVSPVPDKQATNAPLPLPSITGMRVRKDSISPLVLQYIGKDGRSLDEIETHMKDIGRTASRGALRTMLMNLRVNNGFVESPSKGFYKLSDAGVKAVGFDGV